MGRRRQEIEDPELSENLTGTQSGEAQEEAETALEAESIEKIEALLTSNDLAGGTVAIKRRKKGDIQAETIHTRLPISDLDLENLRTVYGGGEYELIFRSVGGQIIKGGRQRVLFAEAPSASAESHQQPVAHNGESKLAEILAGKKDDSISVLAQMFQMAQQQNQVMMQAQQAQFQQTLQMMATAMAQPKPTPMKDIAQMLAPFIPLAVKLIEGRANEGPMKTIEMIAKVKELFPGAGDEGGGTVDRLLSTLGPVIASRLATATGGTPAQAVTVGPAEQPKVEPAPELPPPQETDPEMIKRILIQQLQAVYPTMAKAAAKGVDPESYYNVWASEIEDQPQLVLDQLVALLKADDWTQQVYGKQTIPNQEWFTAVRNFILEDFGPQPEQPAQVQTPQDVMRETIGVVPTVAEKPKEKAKK